MAIVYIGRRSYGRDPDGAEFSVIPTGTNKRRQASRQPFLALHLGASKLDLRRTLLAESLLLCTAGAALGVVLARPMVAVLTKYASRYSVRALDLTVDSSMLWAGAGLAVMAAALLAFVPKLPSWSGGQAQAISSGRRATATNRKLKIFALVQIAASFVLVVAAAATINTVLAMQAARTAFDTRRVLAVNVPVMRDGKSPGQVVDFYRELVRQVRGLPGVLNVACGSVPWRDRGVMNIEFARDGHLPAPGAELSRADFDVVSPGYFASLGLPILEGRDFTDADRAGSEPVAIISEGLARRYFPNESALNHHVTWTDPLLKFAPIKPQPRRIIGIAPDVDNVNVAAQPKMIVYHPSDQEQLMIGGRLLIHVSSNPYALVQPVRQIIRNLSTNQPVERPSTLEDIKSEVIAPERLNAAVSGVFAGVALLIAVVGVAGVLAFSVSGRMREFGVRLAVGSAPRQLLMRVIAEGAAMAVGGLALGCGCGYWFAQLVGSVVGELKMPGVLPVAGAAAVLLTAAVVASAVPAMRAARVDVMEALRAE